MHISLNPNQIKYMYFTKKLVPFHKYLLCELVNSMHVFIDLFIHVHVYLSLSVKAIRD